MHEMGNRGRRTYHRRGPVLLLVRVALRRKGEYARKRHTDGDSCFRTAATAEGNSGRGDHGRRDDLIMSGDSTIPMGLPKPRIVVVDAEDRVVACKDRNALEPGDIYRVTSLWLKNSKGEVLLAQRALTKKKDPGKWSCAVAGTVDEGEEYDDNIIKEIREEIGISIPIEALQKGPNIFIHGNSNDFFDQWYVGTVPADTVLTRQEDEVAALRWMSPEEVRTTLREHPDFFIASAHEWLPRMLEEY